jgi:hypothetical protein
VPGGGRIIRSNRRLVPGKPRQRWRPSHACLPTRPWSILSLHKKHAKRYISIRYIINY